MNVRSILRLFLFAGICFGVWSGVSYLIRPVDQGPLLFDISRKTAIELPLAFESKMNREELARRVNQAWDRIETKLKNIAPGGLTMLRGGATEEQIQRLEREIGFPLMADYRASLKRHNGTSDYFGVFKFLSTEGVIAERRRHVAYNLETDALTDDWDFKHENGVWDPSALTIGIAHFDLILECDTGRTLIQERMNYSGEHHDSFLDALEYIAECFEEGHGYTLHGEGDTRSFSLDGFGCSHY